MNVPKAECFWKNSVRSQGEATQDDLRFHSIREGYLKMNLSQIYVPRTATPFQRNEKYVEFVPCDALKPYIRCFWGTPKRVYIEQEKICANELVTPDTCMDILFFVDFKRNAIHSSFCGINDKSFYDKQQYQKGDTFFSLQSVFMHGVLYFFLRIICVEPVMFFSMLDNTFRS